MTEELPPHAIVWDFGPCLACDVGRWHVITIPQLSTGLQFPQFGICTHCLHRMDLSDLPAFMPDDGDLRPCTSCGRPVECEPGYPDDVQVVCSACIGVRRLKRQEPS
jgi:hypothetical protein